MAVLIRRDFQREKEMEEVGKRGKGQKCLSEGISEKYEWKN